MVKVPAPRQIMTSAKIEAFIDPSLIVVLTKRPGEPAALKILLPGDMGGVDAAIIFS